MAVDDDLLARDEPGPRRGSVALLVLMTVIVFAALHLFSHPATASVRLTVQPTNAEPVRVLHVTGADARRLTADVAHLQIGRIPCGALGPADVVVTLPSGSYDINGECARVVRLPEHPGEQVWLESAALHTDIATALAR